MSQKVAFFDVDGTVFRSSLLIELVEALIAEEIFNPSVRDDYQSEYNAWRNREGSYERYIGAVIDAYMDNLKGVHYGDVADIGRAMVAAQSKHVYRYTRDLIEKLKKQDYYVVAISQSPKTILDEFCRQYGFDKVYGRIYEIGPQDKFTGEVTDEHLIQNKANIIARVLEKEDVVIENSIGVEIPKVISHS
ncbi:MAG: HAD-IB family phosphatase [Candidatus Paceibacterota bacterium]